MKILINKWIIWVLLGVMAACADDRMSFDHLASASSGVRLVLAPSDMPVIETRSGTAESDSRIEHVIVYVFDETGAKLMQFQQDLEHPDREVRPLLPEGRQLKIHAVCNYPQLWNSSIQKEVDLEGMMLTIDQPDGAFNGAMVMHGEITLTSSDVENKEQENKIQVTRLAARVELDLSFQPEIKNDTFYLSNIRLCNIPNRSYLKMRPQVNGDTIPRAEGDVVYTENAQLQPTYYFTEQPLSYTTDHNGHSHTQAYLFENRWGCEKDDSRYSSKFAGNEEMWQTLKGEAAQERSYSSYLQIEGYYKSGKVTAQAKYRIYLGTDNYKDFNVYRNSFYKVTGTIRACNRLDTRVEMMVLGGSHISPSFQNPLDAHFNAVPCFAFTRNEGWELYVEDPDLHPWLEISFSPQYRPHIAGKPIKAGEEHLYAGTRFEGKEALTTYFYVHTDEYIPENPAANEALNNTLEETSWRTGYVVLRDKVNGSIFRLEVKQRPAQVVRMPVKNLLGQVKFYNEYFIEYELERKNLTWGFLKYGANPVMTSMINDRWDGLANTRRLYQEAIKVGPLKESFDADIYRGAYNGYNTVDKEYPWIKDDTLAVINRIPDNHMIKYVLGKNRDRNGNGFIDYDEIVWYVPALDELAILREKLDQGSVVFQNSNDRFHSSTPYLAGYSADVPGRAFYVKMGQGEKAFAMRDRQYNVLCCRRKNAWTGDPDAGIGGDITVNPGWNEDEEDILPKN